MEAQEQAFQKAKQAGVSPITGYAPPIASRFKPGQSGNPKGRPLSAAVDRQIMADEKRMTALVEAYWKRLERGNLKALEMLWNRVEGKVADKLEAHVTERTIVIEAGMEETPEPIEIECESQPAIEQPGVRVEQLRVPSHLPQGSVTPSPTPPIFSQSKTTC